MTSNTDAGSGGTDDLVWLGYRDEKDIDTPTLVGGRTRQTEAEINADNAAGNDCAGMVFDGSQTDGVVHKGLKHFKCDTPAYFICQVGKSKTHF